MVSRRRRGQPSRILTWRALRLRRRIRRAGWRGSALVAPPRRAPLAGARTWPGRCNRHSRSAYWRRDCVRSLRPLRCVVRGGIRPGTVAGVGDATGETGEIRTREQGVGGEIEEPGANHTAPPPHLGTVGKTQRELIVLGIIQRRRFGISRRYPLADVG